MLSILQNISESCHGDLMPKLMKLAFYGMKENHVDFTEGYIESLGLDMDNLCHSDDRKSDVLLIECVAGNNTRLRFAHKNLQEILASLYACNLDLNEFKKFIEEYYEKPGMELVIKHIFEIVLNKLTSESVAKYVPVLSDVKFEYLTEYLAKLFEGKVISDKRTITILHECGPDVIEKLCSHIEEMRLDYLEPSEQYAVISVAQHIASLHILHLNNLEIYPWNYSSLQKIWGFVHSIYVDWFHLHNCDPEVEKMQVLSEATMKGNFKVGSWFKLKDSPALQPVGFYHSISIVHHCGAKNFGLDGCDLNAEKMKNINKAVAENSIKLE